MNIINFFKNRKSKFVKFKFWQNAYDFGNSGINGMFFIKGNIGVFENNVRVWVAGKCGADSPEWIGKVRIAAGQGASRWFWLEVPNSNHIWDKTMDEIGEVNLTIPSDLKGDIYVELDCGFSTSPMDGGRLQKHMSWRMIRKVKISD